MTQPTICVVGSINLDMNAYVTRFPMVGETLSGLRFTTGYGGKGANQAVMAARLGGAVRGAVRFVGRVGDDLFGRDMHANLASEGIDVTHVAQTAGVSSGVAVITVNEAGDNSIIVIAGANGQVSAADAEAAAAAIAGARVLVCQLEIPVAASLAAMKLARAAGVMTIFNPAPARADLPLELFQLSDLCCPNETEAELLTGQPVRTLADAEVAARQLLARGARRVLVTLGARGCLLVDGETVQHVAAPQVQAVDTTGAGDAFVGSLAFFLADGRLLPDAVDRANRIAAVSVQAPGTQSSFPYRKDLPASLFA